MYIYDNLTCPIALISIIQIIIVEMDSAIQDNPDILNGNIQYERGRPQIELSAEELIFIVGKKELKGPFNYYVTLILANFSPVSPCHKVSHWRDPSPVHPMGIISLDGSYGFSAKLTGLRWVRRWKFDQISNSSQQSQTICFSSQIHASSHQSKSPWWLRRQISYNMDVPIAYPI